MDDRNFVEGILMTLVFDFVLLFGFIESVTEAKKEREDLKQQIQMLRQDQEQSKSEIRQLDGEVQYFLTGGWK